MMKRAVIVFLVVLCIIAVCVYAAQPLETQASRRALRRKLLKSRQTGSVGDVSFRFKIRLRDGVPVLKLKLGTEQMTVIFDTGSSQLNVGHQSCSDCSKADGVYRGPVPALSTRRNIYYGSQHDTVVDMADTLELPDGAGNTSSVLVPFVTTVSRETGNQGNSSLNVMGMYSGRHPSDSNLTSYILPSGFTLVVDLADSGYVAGVSPSKAEQIRRMYPDGFVQSPLTRLKALPFFVVRVLGIEVCGRSLDGSPKIKWCVIDTGSNMLTLPPKVCKKALDCISSAVHPSITLHLAGGTIQMERRHLMWRGSNEAMIDDDIAAIGASKSLQQQTMVIGTHSMQGRCLMFTDELFFVSA